MLVILPKKGIRRLLNFIKPDVWEYEIEAETYPRIYKNRSKGFAYTPIIARKYANNSALYC